MRPSRVSPKTEDLFIVETPKINANSSLIGSIIEMNGSKISTGWINILSSFTLSSKIPPAGGAVNTAL
jgi:hypothetical protein